MSGPSILTLDIETLPLTTFNWSLFDEPRALDRLVKDWAIFMGAWKWLGERPVTIMDTEVKGDPYDDIELVRAMCEVLDEADIVVGQNIKKFDMGKIRSRAVYHGLKPFREPQIADTLLMSREVGRFTSNKLEYVSTMTATQKSKHKKYPGFALWQGVLDGEPGAYKEARAYNRDDVRSTEQWYLKLRPWVRQHPNVAQFYDDEHLRCPRCGSKKLQPQGLIHRGVSTYTEYVCGACFGHSRSRYTENTTNKRRNLLTCF